MPSPTRETILAHEQRILASSDRLSKLIRLKAPRAIIVNEIAMLVRKATLVYGADMWTQIGKYLTDPVRGHYGECRECLAEVEPPYAVCKACHAEVEAAMQEYETED